MTLQSWSLFYNVWQMYLQATMTVYNCKVPDCKPDTRKLGKLDKYPWMQGVAFHSFPPKKHRNDGSGWIWWKDQKIMNHQANLAEFIQDILFGVKVWHQNTQCPCNFRITTGRLQKNYAQQTDGRTVWDGRGSSDLPSNGERPVAK